MIRPQFAIITNDHMGGVDRPCETRPCLRKIKVTDETEKLFIGLPESFKVGRYHSWVVEKDLPEVLIVTAIDEQDNSVMALRHKDYDVRGVQFHPESVLTEYGKEMMANWLKG